MGNLTLAPFKLPPDSPDRNARQFVFEIQPQEPTAGREFNLDMTVEKGVLIWNRSGRDLRYVRQ